MKILVFFNSEFYISDISLFIESGITHTFRFVTFYPARLKSNWSAQKSWLKDRERSCLILEVP